MEKNTEVVKALKDINLSNPFIISADQVEEILQQCSLTHEELLQQLVPVAQQFARPPISNYLVGAAVLGKSGAIYLGVNLEFQGVPLNQAVHGEQFAVTMARQNGETGLIAIAISAAPCGHCRQFMSEISDSKEIRVLIPNEDPMTLGSLLPYSFGPEDLGISERLFNPQAVDCSSPSNQLSLLTSKALEAAISSYAPYTTSKSGVAIQTQNGKIYMGSYLENAAYNPSLSPLQSALIALVADICDYSEIVEVVLVEKQSAKISQKHLSEEIIKDIAPQALFRVEALEF